MSWQTHYHDPASVGTLARLAQDIVFGRIRVVDLTSFRPPALSSSRRH